MLAIFDFFQNIEKYHKRQISVKIMICKMLAMQNLKQELRIRKMDLGYGNFEVMDIN